MCERKITHPLANARELRMRWWVGVLHTIALEAITTSRYPFATGKWRRHFKMLGFTRGLSPSGISAI